MRYRFDEFIFDVDSFELRRVDGGRIKLQPKSLEFLLLLLRHPGRLITKELLAQEVWGKQFVSDNVVSSQMRKLREALRDRIKPHRILETVPGRGLRFISEVQSEGELLQELLPARLEDFAQSNEGSLLESSHIGDQPSIAVLPFLDQELSGHRWAIAQALPTDILTALSRFRLLRVVARSSSFMLSSSANSLKQIRALLNCDYCLTGSVSRVGEKYEVFTELIDTSSEAILWAESFEIEPRDIHGLRAQIVSQVVSKVEEKVPEHEAKKVTIAGPESLTAWQAFHVGTSLIYRRGEANIERAQRFLERAVAIDPSFSRAWAGLAHTYSFEVINRPFESRKVAKRLLMQAAERAVDTEPDDPSANLWLGRAMSMTKAEGDPTTWIERAIELAPSYALAHQQLATTHVYQDQHSRALDHASASLLLNPHGPERFANYTVMSLALFKTGDYHRAIEWSKKAGKVPYNNLHILLSALFTNHWTGDVSEAKRIAERIKTAFPGVSQAEIFKFDSLAGNFSQMAGSALTAHGIH
ncbi:MAG: winged helix-turn-helix domain-containing protein [Pseudomonadota bacterium]